MSTLINPGLYNERYCECGNLFSTAIPNRMVCLHCKPVTKKELAGLMAHGGVTKGKQERKKL